MRRPQKFNFSLKALINDIWTHIYGLITVISFIAAIFFTIVTLNKQQVAFKDVLYVCLALITLLSIIIIRISAKYSQLHTMSADLLNYQRENENLITLIQLQAETTHNITHYFRSLIYDFDKVINKINKDELIEQNEIDYICDRNNHFLIMLTTSLQNFFSIYTDDNCSIALKTLNTNKTKIKTIFRDPVNLKKRRQAELNCGLDTYDILDNTAFEVILGSNYKDYFYAKDNLSKEYSDHNYKNGNQQWNNFYNSTIVVPISKIDHSNNQRNILGFLTVDNMSGYLVDNTTIEYMQGISDLLYNYFYKFNIISNHTKLNSLNNDRQNDFIWD